MVASIPQGTWGINVEDPEKGKQTLTSYNSQE